MVATPLIAVFLDVRLAILLTLLPTIGINLASIWGSDDYKSSLREYGVLFVFTLIGSIMGAYMLATLDPSPFRLALASLIFLYLWTTYSGRPWTILVSASPFLVMAGFGFVSGISAGITNVMIAILIVYFLSLEISKSRMIPVVNTCFLIGKVTQIVVLSAAGITTMGMLIQTTPLAVCAIAGLRLGRKFGDNIDPVIYKKTLYGLLAILAIILILQFANEI